jgi:hypothetical protein
MNSILVPENCPGLEMVMVNDQIWRKLYPHYRSRDTEIIRLKHKGVLVESVHEQGEFINNIFTRPKKDGSRRMILNLKPLNAHIAYHKFKMDTLRTVLRLINKGCYMANVDIRDAYYMVPIYHLHQKYLKFQWRNKLYQYTALPNGYAAAPRVFTKLLKPVFAHLRQKGITVMGYIDDVYIQGDTKEECQHAVSVTCSLLQKCGFLIHKAYSRIEILRV